MDDIDRDAMMMLQSYQWPGNVRELENVMQRAIILAPGKTVRAEDLSLNTEEADVDSGENGDIERRCRYRRLSSRRLLRATASRL
jgi:DNA-binding NtrC family response regulator